MPPISSQLFNVASKDDCLSEDPYKAELERVLATIDPCNFKVNNYPQIVFICGGEIEQKSSKDAKAIPASLRERILINLAKEHSDIERNCVVAESFKDYFQKGSYKNLLEFESDIANIASLIVVCLESAGSLVEFGIFTSHEQTIKKLQVFVPQEFYNNVHDEQDSFIKLGPLAELESMRDDAVLVYPFPNKDKLSYEDIDVVIGDITTRLSEEHAQADFDNNNSGHLAFLIHDLISLAYPIKIPEIELCIKQLGINTLDERRISSLIYLLKKTRHIGIEKYSGTDYLYPLNHKLNRIAFGKSRDGKVFDRAARFIEIRGTFGFINKAESQLMKKRRLAMMKIAAKMTNKVEVTL